MRRVEAASSARSPRVHRAAVCAVLAVLLCGALVRQQAEAGPGGADGAGSEGTPLGFALIADALTRPADEASVRQLLDAIARERDMSFIVYDGNIKGPTEPCRDNVYESRHDLLDASRTPLILLPGQHDWADCALAQAGGYDPVERLDFVRQLFFGDATSLGQTPLSLARESEVARFRPFRENVRWQANGIAFIGLNAPSPNNHYLTAGGRNGEFEDRSVASTFWLEHAAESARRAELRALVVIIQGDPDFSRYERRDRFSWLRFSHGNQGRDGFLEFKRSLVKAAELFRGPVIVIHGSETALPNGFRIDQPLHNDKGAVVANLTRIAMALHKPQAQWLEVETDFGWRPPFRVRVRDVALREGSAAAPAEASPALPAEPPSEASAPNPAPHFQPWQSQPRNDLPASLPVAPRLPPPTPPTSPSQPSLPPILSPPQALPPILPTPASGVPNGAYGTYRANPSEGGGE
ncbi:Probable transmembrane protein [Caballeronia glathei]|uniref:Calcineurin-like phosphoesterase domain-containing protein n=1 Tax=Caballeronia glathei TaxID=60547 RepID=A0A069PRL0_9BURK|nr:hypothetical protein [Caballeronia glathei]KDR43378.1 hypothetical protein BG61_38290 [Caballeronia glathei]CDY78713.1 Probable transmembrane protein [Caballeronia glathei]